MAHDSRRLVQRLCLLSPFRLQILLGLGQGVKESVQELRQENPRCVWLDRRLAFDWPMAWGELALCLMGPLLWPYHRPLDHL